MENVRSRGVTIFGFLNKYIFGILNLIIYICLLIGPINFLSESQKEIYKVRFPQLSGGVPSQIRIYFLLSAMIAVGLIITGHGLLRLKEKARQWTIYVALFSIVADIVLPIFTRKGLSIFSLLYCILLIYFFTRSEVKAQFR